MFLITIFSRIIISLTVITQAMIRYFAALLVATNLPYIACSFVAIKGDGYEGCIEPEGGELNSGNSVILGDCSDILNTWQVEQTDRVDVVRLHARGDDNVCLQATHTGDLVDGAWLRTYPCSGGILQDFTKGDDGSISPSSRPDL